MLDLKQTQEIFWKLMQAPEGVARALDAWRMTGEVPFEELREFLKEETPGKAGDRLENYAQMYFWRLFESLKEDYPVSLAVLGEEAFHRLMIKFFRANPSRYRDLALLSGDLPGFLEKNSDLPSKDRGILRDLSRMEWAFIELSRAKDPRILTGQDLKKLPPEQWGDLSLKLIPQSRWLRTRWPIFSLWEACRGEQPLPRGWDSPAGFEDLLIWRHGFQVRIKRLNEEEAGLLAKVRDGITFGKLCESFTGDDPEKGAGLAAGYLREWLEMEILAK